MLIILSPAKKQDFDESVQEHGHWPFPEQTQKIVDILTSQSQSDLKQTLGVSDALAALNFDRYKNFNHAQSKAALMAYQGDVYRYMERENWSQSQHAFANESLIIISALYGALKPQTAIHPYRLEMINHLKDLGDKLKNYWKNPITTLLNQHIAEKNEKFILNLASKEYSEVVDRKKLQVPVVDVDFLEYSPAGKLRTVAVNAKRARGALIKHIVTEQMTSLSFSGLNIRDYIFDEKASSDHKMIFIKD